MKKKIIFFSGSRAEYNIQFPILKIFQKSKQFDTYFVIAGSHTSKSVGDTFKQIKKDNIKVNHKIDIKLNSNIDKSLNDYSIELQNQISKVLLKVKPDCIFLTSDRFETLSVAIVSHFLRIPIIHLEGGDVTEGGTLDDNSRHAITKLANFHLTTNIDSKKRVLKLGEEKNNVFDIGFPPLIAVKKKKLIKKKEIEKIFDIKKNEKIILFTYHPVPAERKKIKLIFNSLKKIQNKLLKIIITYPNFDPGYELVINEINKLKDKKINIIIRENLGRSLYFSLLNYLGKYDKGICMGNSSSGIKETLFFNCKTINLGNRQKTRLKTKNIYECQINYHRIKKEIFRALKLKVDYTNVHNPYFLRKSLVPVTKKIFSLLNKKRSYQKKITY